MNIRDDAQLIIKEAIDRAMPDNAVKAALGSVSLPHKVKLVAIGKAGYQMARAAYDHLGSRIEKGVIITKYGHSAGSFSEDIAIYEAGHPVPDDNSVRGAEAALSLAHSLTQKDTLIFLVSGGGSALFESPLVSLEELQDVNRQLLASGADITEMNTIRKRLSAVTGETKGQLEALGISIPDVLKDNDSYNALKQIDGLIFTGPTGTNVNDVCCLLIK